MDKVMKVFPGIGEVGIDTEASPGNGAYYVKLYDGSYDAVGFDSEEEAVEEFEFATAIKEIDDGQDDPGR